MVSNLQKSLIIAVERDLVALKVIHRHVLAGQQPLPVRLGLLLHDLRHVVLATVHALDVHRLTNGLVRPMLRREVAGVVHDRTAQFSRALDTRVACQCDGREHGAAAARSLGKQWIPSRLCVRLLGKGGEAVKLSHC